MSAVVLFDGVCNLCNAAVRTVLAWERGPTLRFAALQSEAARALLEGALGGAGARALREPPGGVGPKTIAVVDGPRVYTESDAVLRIARELRAPLSWVAVLWIVPRPVRDAAYRFVAARRYAWFGTSTACAIPTPDVRARFLDAAA